MMTLYEQETIINYNREEKMAEVYTCDPLVMRKLDELVESYPNCYKLIRETRESKTYSFPKKMLAFRKPVVMSLEQRKKAIANLEKIRNKKEE